MADFDSGPRRMANLDTPEFIDPEISWVLVPMLLLVILLFLLAVCDGWPDIQKHALEHHLRPLFLVRHRGTFEAYKKGPDNLDRKTASQDTLQGLIDPNRAGIYSQAFRTAPIKVWRSIGLSGFYSLGMAWCIVNGVYYDKVRLSSVFRSMEAAQVMLGALLPVTSCLLAFYVILRLSRFNQVVEHVGEVSGALEEIALVVGCMVKDQRREKDPQVIETMWILYRHLNIVHILIYLQISPRFAHHSIPDLKVAGFINEAEKQALHDSVDPAGLATFWVGHILTELHRSEVFDERLTTSLMRSLSDLRSATSCLVQEAKRVAPMTFVQIMQMAVDAVCMLSTPVIIHKFLIGNIPIDAHVRIFATSTMTSTLTTTTTTTSTTTSAFGLEAMAMMYNNSRLSIYCIPLISTMMVTLLYQGSIQVVKETEDPFATGMDRLNPDIVLDLTEKKIGMYLRRDSANFDMLRFPSLQSLSEARRVADDASSLDENYEKHDDNASLDGRQRAESVCSLTSSVAPLPERDDGRQWLPTAVVLSGITIAKLTDGAHQDARDLHRGVHDKLQKLELDLLDKLETDDPYLTAVNEMLPRLQQDSLSNAHLREQVISSVAGMSQMEAAVMENPLELKRGRSRRITRKSQQLQKQLYPE